MNESNSYRDTRFTPLFSISRVHFGRTSTTIQVSLLPNAPTYTTPQLAAFCLQARPTLRLHACQNDGARTLGDVIDHTLILHLFEHLIIDILVELTSQAQAQCAGITELLDDQGRVARISLTCARDEDVLRALFFAHEIISKGVTH